MTPPFAGGTGIYFFFCCPGARPDSNRYPVHNGSTQARRTAVEIVNIAMSDLMLAVA